MASLDAITTLQVDIESIRLQEEATKKIIQETVHSTLTALGVDYTKPLEMQKDFQYLREWREARDLIKKRGLLFFVGLFLTAMVTAVVLGAKAYFNG